LFLSKIEGIPLSNSVRILALGDSFVWGDGLNDEELVMQNLKNPWK